MCALDDEKAVLPENCGQDGFAIDSASYAYE